MKGCYRLKCFGFGVSNVAFAKKPNLTDFARIPKSGIIIWENMLTIILRHFIQALAASLGKNNGPSRLYGSQI